MNDENITIGAYIKQIRIKKKLTYGQFAIKGISKSTLSQIESDKRKAKAETLKQIAEILKINPIELYIFAHLVDDDMINDYVKKRDNN